MINPVQTQSLEVRLAKRRRESGNMSGGTEEATATEQTSPPSPAVPPVRLSDCLEELIRYTLAAAGSREERVGECLNLGISRDYCLRLLQEDTPTVHPQPNNARFGVPAYPLCRQLAFAIEQCINSGTFRKAPESMMSIPVDESLKTIENYWTKLIMDTAIELSNILEAVDFELHVQEPYFSQLRDGLKTVEGRCATGKYDHITPGDLLLFNKCLLLEVQNVKRFNSFSEMLQGETLTNVLPEVKTLEEGVQVYRKFYTEEKEMSTGVLAISVSKPTSQPCTSIATLLSGLGYGGIGSLLGMEQTAGTVTDALPPPRSSLISSSLKQYQPNVRGCSLTNAARELSKHVNRSSNGWWGSLVGNDTSKNILASEVINRLLNDCCWMNVHLIRPYDCVYEIRNSEGYGARWSKDGLQLIGFLEPYNKEGYSKGWKH